MPQITSLIDSKEAERFMFLFAAMQMEAVRFLIEERGSEVNQRAQKTGWTPLMRCAQMAHYTNQPYMQATTRKFPADWQNALFETSAWLMCTVAICRPRGKQEVDKTLTRLGFCCRSLSISCRTVLMPA